MSRPIWHAIKENKSFNIRLYRRGCMVLAFSMGLNVVLILFSAFSFLSQTEPNYYASDGVRLPILLQPYASPNYSANYMLPPDTPSEDENLKMIPQ